MSYTEDIFSTTDPSFLSTIAMIGELFKSYMLLYPVGSTISIISAIILMVAMVITFICLFKDGRVTSKVHQVLLAIGAVGVFIGSFIVRLGF